MFPKICRVVSGFPEHDQSISDIFLKGISNHCLSKTLLLSHVEIKAIKKKSPSDYEWYINREPCPTQYFDVI